jgi:hypothetical protein
MFIERPPGFAELAMTVLTALATLCAYSPPGYFSVIMRPVVASWLALVSLLTARIAFRLTTSFKSQSRTYWLRAAALPLLLIMCILLVRREIPLRIVFARYETEFDQAAKAAARLSIPFAPYETNVGPYHLRAESYSGMAAQRFSVAGDPTGRCFLFEPPEHQAALAEVQGSNLVRITPNWFLLKR